MTKKKYHINKPFKTEPGEIPDKNSLWQKIDASLLTDDLYYELNKENLDYAIEDLPNIMPVKNIWNEIQDELPVKKIGSRKQRKMLYACSAIAAGLVLGLFIHVFIKSRLDEDITYTKEIIIVADNTQGKKIDCDDMKSKIELLCKNKPVACKNEDFIKLKDKLDQLILEKQKLNDEVLLNSGHDIQAFQVLVDTQIKNVEQQIITFLTT